MIRAAGPRTGPRQDQREFQAIFHDLKGKHHMNRLRITMGLLGVGTIMITGAGCATQSEVPIASSSATVSGSTDVSPSAAASSTQVASETQQGTEDPEDLYPVLKAAAGENDKLPAEADLDDIDPASVRSLGSSAYASQFVAVTKDKEVCLIAWAIPGSGDGTPVNYGSPGIECEDVDDVVEDGLGVRVEPEKDASDLVAFLLPPDMEEDQVRKTVLAIPGNHEDLRPPVEINTNVDGSITLAMDTATADELGSIEIPRPDGTTLSLSEDSES